jgi:thioredoxin 2
VTEKSALIRCSSCRTVNRVPAEKIRDRPKCGKCKLFLSFPFAPVEITDANFRSEVMDWPGYALVFFWAPWCGHCPGMMIYMKDVARERAGLMKVGLLNVDRERMLSSRFEVRSVPKLVLFHNGTMVNEINGAVGKRDLDAWLDHFLV